LGVPAFERGRVVAVAEAATVLTADAPKLQKIAEFFGYRTEVYSYGQYS
jgi:hypothetical protein